MKLSVYTIELLKEQYLDIVDVMVTNHRTHFCKGCVFVYVYMWGLRHDVMMM